jgi:hypothetical protein
MQINEGCMTALCQQENRFSENFTNIFTAA